MCSAARSSGNSAEASGGGLFNGNDFESGIATFTNSTFSGNTAGANGGGIFNNNGTVTLKSSTVAENKGSITGGINNGGFDTNVFNLSNTLVAGNESDAGGQDCAGTITSHGYNLIQVATDCAVVGDATGNLLNVDPSLGPLQDNGGNTLTMRSCQEARR